MSARGPLDGYRALDLTALDLADERGALAGRQRLRTGEVAW